MSCASSLSASTYMQNHELLLYLQDAIAQLLIYKEDNPKVNVKKFLADYFVCVKDAKHTIHREYNYVSATHHNRTSFVATFWKCFHYIAKSDDLLSLKEYHSLILLLCSDFPFNVVHDAGRIVLMDDAMECLVNFSDFLYAFQIQFVYQEFLERCFSLYESLLKGPSYTISSAPGGQKPVVVPTDVASICHANASFTRSEGVSATEFLRLVQGVCEKLDIQVPKFDIIKTVLCDKQTTTYFGFVMALMKNERLNAALGLLPVHASHLRNSKCGIISSSLHRNTSLASVSAVVTMAARSAERKKKTLAKPLSSIIQSKALLAADGTVQSHVSQQQQSPAVAPLPPVKRAKNKCDTERFGSTDDDDDDEDDDEDDDDDDDNADTETASDCDSSDDISVGSNK